MKKFQYLALLLAAFMTISCEKDIVNNQNWIVDWAPLELFVYLSDADGNNLLDPEYEHAYDSANMVLTYEGEEYEVTI